MSRLAIPSSATSLSPTARPVLARLLRPTAQAALEVLCCTGAAAAAKFTAARFGHRSSTMSPPDATWPFRAVGAVVAVFWVHHAVRFHRRLRDSEEVPGRPWFVAHCALSGSVLGLLVLVATAEPILIAPPHLRHDVPALTFDQPK